MTTEEGIADGARDRLARLLAALMGSSAVGARSGFPCTQRTLAGRLGQRMPSCSGGPLAAGTQTLPPLRTVRPATSGLEP